MKRQVGNIPGLYFVRGWMECCHLLVNGDEVILLDTGLWGEHRLILRQLRELGLDARNVRAILLTHGHLDHAGNLARLVELTGAPVYAHREEQRHVDGNYPYRGMARGCQWMEGVGYALFRYRGAQITHLIEDGDELPFWGGLRVMHLPGHTLGHCAFYSAQYDLLFSGDLFASYGLTIHQPPPFLNSCPALFPESFARVLELNPRLILPNHYDKADPALHAERFKKWKASKLRSATASGIATIGSQ